MPSVCFKAADGERPERVAAVHAIKRVTGNPVAAIRQINKAAGYIKVPRPRDGREFGFTHKRVSPEFVEVDVPKVEEAISLAETLEHLGFEAMPV